MTNSRRSFDAIGVVVDWIDAHKTQRLNALLSLYDDNATVACCEGGTYNGRAEVERYWRREFARPAAGAFAIDALLPEADIVSLDYRGHDGKPVRTHFHFNDAGRISRTVCARVEAAA